MKDWYYKYINNSFEKLFHEQDISINENEVLVEPIRVGICGSDLFSIFHNVEKPAIGHEWVGKIVALGGNVKGYEVGEIITSGASYCCQKCGECSKKNWANCTGRKLLGSDDVSVISNSVKIHFSDLVKLPQDLSLNSLVLLEVAFIGDLAYFKADQIGLKSGDSVAIFGGGPIGVFSYLALKHRGYSPVLVEKNPVRVQKLKDLGYEVENFAEFLISGNHFKKFDYVIDCSGDGAGGAGALAQIHLFVKTSGGVVIIGKYNKAKIDNDSFHRYNLRINWLGYHSVEEFKKSVEFWTPIIDKYSDDLVENIEVDKIDSAFDIAIKRDGFKTVLSIK